MEGEWNLIDSLLDFWNKRSRLFRWTLFIPVSALFSCLAFLLFYAALYVLSCWRQDFAMWYPLRGIVAQAILLLTLNATAPQRGDIVVLVFVLLRALVLATLVAAIFVPIGYFQEKGMDRTCFWDCASEVVVLVTGLLIYRHCRREIRDQTRLAAAAISAAAAADALSTGKPAKRKPA